MHADDTTTPLRGTRRRPGPQPKPLAELFWPKVDRSGGPDACWPWLAATTDFGHGVFARQRGSSGTRVAHRVAWELVNGPIPAGMVLRHRCHNPRCVNPAHLLPGTQGDNARDRYARNPHNPKGTRQPPPPRKERPARLDRRCPTCGTAFTATPSRVAAGAGKFCSRPCVRIPVEDRFWRKVRKTEGCWLWTGAITGFGYGVLGRGGEGAGNVLAHRLSWELHNGAVPPNLFVLHRCDNPLCVRPDHLFLGTKQDNALDCVRKGRNGPAKLIAAKVTEMRRLYAGTNLTCAEIGARYGVASVTAWKAITGLTWGHVLHDDQR